MVKDVLQSRIWEGCISQDSTEGDKSSDQAILGGKVHFSNPGISYFNMSEVRRVRESSFDERVSRRERRRESWGVKVVRRKVA